MKQVYKITNIRNNKSYISIVIKEGKTYLDRFEEHMTGLGGKWIWRDLQTGQAQVSDFKIEVLEEGDAPVQYYKDREPYYVDLYDTLYPKGYNGNKGNYIIQTPETIRKSQQTRLTKLAAGIKYKKPGRFGYANYRYPDGTIRSLPIDHPDVISSRVRHVNYNPNSGTQVNKRNKKEERARNNGLTDAQVRQSETMKIIGKTYVNNPNWLQGREKFRQRMKNREYTDAQIAVFKQRTEMVKKTWTKIPKEDRHLRTSQGLSIMNARYICEHCNIETNKGNYGRWHGNKCKHKK